MKIDFIHSLVSCELLLYPVCLTLFGFLVLWRILKRQPFLKFLPAVVYSEFGFNAGLQYMHGTGPESWWLRHIVGAFFMAGLPVLAMLSAWAWDLRIFRKWSVRITACATVVAFLWIGHWSASPAKPGGQHNPHLSNAGKEEIYALCQQKFYVDRLQDWAIETLKQHPVLTGPLTIPDQCYRTAPKTKAEIVTAEFEHTGGDPGSGWDYARTEKQRWVFVKLFDGDIEGYHHEIFRQKNGLIFGPRDALDPFDKPSAGKEQVAPGVFYWHSFDGYITL